jgi:ABC-2 type transport system permease protein
MRTITTRSDSQSRAAQLIRSEWIKQLSLRSTPIALGLVVAAVLVGGLDTARTVTQSQLFDPVYDSANGFTFAALPAGVFGALAMTSEFATGTIRSTAAAVPRRAHLLAAKAVACAALLFATAELSTFINLILVHLLAAKRSIPVPLTSLTDLRAVLGTGISLTLLGLLGLGIGALVRNTTAAAGTVAGLVLIGVVAPNATILPEGAGSQIYRTIRDQAGVSPWAGLIILLTWTAAALAFGAHVLSKVDL